MTTQPASLPPAADAAGPDTADPSGIRAIFDRATRGESAAWRELVTRFRPLVVSVCRRFALDGADAEDICQTVWLRLFEHLDAIRDPRALPGWISTTTRREAIQVTNRSRRADLMEPAAFGELAVRGLDEPDAERALLVSERRAALTGGLAELRPQHRQLLVLAHVEPRLSYQEIGHQLGMPVGSIGPTRARCIDKLRGTTALQRLLAADPTATVAVPA